MSRHIHPAIASERVSQGPRKPLNPALMAFFVGGTTFLLGVVVAIVTRYYFPGTLISAFTDDLIIGIGAGLLVFLYERRRNRYLREQLGIVAEMNHHVRNALQVVSYSVEKQQDEKLKNMLHESVERIDWALREILPGRQDS